MRYQLSWHSNQSLDASPANARKGAAKAKWEDRFNLSWHTNQDLDFPRSVERKEAAYPQWQDKLNNFLHVTQTCLIGNGEPQVWQSVNAAGQTTWNAYDSGSEKAIYDVSEAELRSWLENLHYQN